MSQSSVVQGFMSLQSRPAPSQTPPAHRSPVVQEFPSLHTSVLFTCAHPVIASQESVVQTLESSQSRLPVPSQVPPPQRSPVVQASSSSHGTVLFMKRQPIIV